MGHRKQHFPQRAPALVPSRATPWVLQKKKKNNSIFLKAYKLSQSIFWGKEPFSSIPFP
jgi:hypothetical protein